MHSCFLVLSLSSFLVASLPLGNVIACLTRWFTSGLLLHQWAWLWGRDGCEKHSILGEEQWKWLEEELLLHPKSVNNGSDSMTTNKAPELFIILSSVQVWSTNPALEGWGQFPAEQERLWNLLERHYTAAAESSSSPVVVFLSGDVHHAEVIGQRGYLEVTSSGMTHHCGQSKLYGRLCRPLVESFSAHRHSPSEYFIGHNYGTVTVDWTKRFVSIRVHDSSATTVLYVEQTLDGKDVALPLYQDIPHTLDGHLIPYARRIGWMWAVAIMTVMVATKLFRRDG